MIVKNLYAATKNGGLFTHGIMPVIPYKYWVFCFFSIAFYGTIIAVKKEQKTYGW